MKTVSRGLVVITIAFVSVVLATSNAFAYRNLGLSVSSSGHVRGSATGKVWLKDTNHIGYNVNVKDRSRDGRCAYLQWKGVRDNMLDTHWYRLTGNACGAGVTKHFAAVRDVVSPGTADLDGFRVRVCIDVPRHEDTCGASVTARRDYNTAG